MPVTAGPKLALWPLAERPDHCVLDIYHLRLQHTPQRDSAQHSLCTGDPELLVGSVIQQRAHIADRLRGLEDHILCRRRKGNIALQRRIITAVTQGMYPLPAQPDLDRAVAEAATCNSCRNIL